MAARKTTVTHADGTVSVRKSQSRIYTHAVEIGPATAATYAAWQTAAADKETARAAQYRAAAAAGKVVVKSRGFRDAKPESLHDYQATLTGTGGYIYTWCSAEGRTQDVVADGKPIVGVRAYLIDYANRYADEIEQRAAEQRAAAAEILAEGKTVGEYGVLRWSSRADLAAKALSEFDYAVQRGHTVRVVPVDA